MGPGRLTGMNGYNIIPGIGMCNAASMGPGRLTGMNEPTPVPQTTAMSFNGARSIDRDERPPTSGVARGRASASMGPGRLTGMNARSDTAGASPREVLQWGPVD